jgi:carbonic anhydrase
MCKTCGDTNHKPELSRRGLLWTGALAALSPWAIGDALAADPPKPAAAPAANAIAPSEALKRLMEGNARYAANKPEQKDFSAGRAARAQGQAPIAAILSCADARLAPEFAFDQAPGELFVARVAGNILTPDLLASFEYGVEFLGIPLVMVLGHSGCGAVDAAIKRLKDKIVLPGHLPELIGAIKPSVVAAEKMKTGNLLDNSIAENVRRQVAQLKSAGPIVQKSYEAKKIDIVGAVYDIPTGKITLV